MILIVNETKNDYKITRKGCELFISRKLRKTETGEVRPIQTLVVAGLDEKLDEMFRDKHYIRLAAGRTTKVFMTIANAITTYGEGGCSINVSALTKETQKEIKNKKPFNRSCIIILTDRESKTGVVNVRDEKGCTVPETMIVQNYDTGEASQTVFVKYAKWSQISDKKARLIMNPTKILHLSYVTIKQNGEDVNINALVRCNEECKPIGKHIARIPNNRKPANGKPFKKPYNKDGNGKNGYRKPFKKSYDGKKQYNNGRSENNTRPNTRRPNIDNSKKPWRSKPDNVETRKRLNNGEGNDKKSYSK